MKNIANIVTEALQKREKENAMLGKILTDIDATIEVLERPNEDLRYKVKISKLALQLARGYLQPWACTLAELALKESEEGRA